MKLVLKVKISNKDTAIAIKMNFKARKKPKEIAALFVCQRKK